MRVKSLHIYPIKSMRGIALHSAEVTALGLLHDRRWMLVDDKGTFITQREAPTLARIDAQLTSAGLRVMADTMGSIDIACPADTLRDVKIWDDQTRAYCASADVNTWFSDFLGRACTLVYQGDIPRAADADWARAQDETSFADGFPLLVTNTASLEDMNARAQENFTMDRFRPNIVIESTLPWDEDTWKTLQIGDVEIDIVKPCARCVITATDQMSGVKEGRGPLGALTKFRLLKTERQTGAIFGQNAIARRYGQIACGDEALISTHQDAPVFLPAKI